MAQTALNLSLQTAITQEGYAAAINNVPAANGFKINITKVQPVVKGVPKGFFPAYGVVVGDGQVRIRSTITSTADEYAFDELWIYDETSGVIFCKVKRTDDGILDFVSPYKTSVINYNIKFSTLPAGTVSIVADAGQSLALAALDSHVSDANPHPQYVRVQEGVEFWREDVTYSEYAFAKDAAGKVYRAKTKNTGKDPSIEANNSGKAAVWEYCPITLTELDSVTRAIASGTTDPVDPPGPGEADKYENKKSGEIWQYFEGIGWATIARQQGAKITGDASLTKFVNSNAWMSPVALKSFVVPRDGDVSIQADAYFTNATTLTFCYTSIYKNLAALEGNQTQYPVPCVTPYQSATLTASRVKVFKGDVITVGFAVGMSCNCQYAFNVQYIN